MKNWYNRAWNRLLTWIDCQKSRFLPKNDDSFEQFGRFDAVFALDEQLDEMLTFISGEQIDMNNEIRSLLVAIRHLNVMIAQNTEKAEAIQRLRHAIAQEESHFRP